MSSPYPTDVMPPCLLANVDLLHSMLSICDNFP